MTALLQQAFEEAAKLPEAEQRVLAERILAELTPEDDFDRAIAQSAHRLSSLAKEALEEHQAGLTEPLDPQRL
jgi:hypothetical protein